MCKELVSLNTQDVSKAIPVTNTKIISERLNVGHRYIKKHLKTQEKYFLRFGLLVVCATESTGGRPEEIIELNEEQAMFLMTLLKNTEEVVEFKFNLVKAFNFMKKELINRVNTRHLVKNNRKSLTDSIKNCVTDEGNFKKFAFGNYTKLIYKKVLGKDVKKSKEERGLKEKDNIRDFMSIEELEKVQELESKVATYIEFTDNTGKTDKEIYQEVKNYIEK